MYDMTISVFILIDEGNNETLQLHFLNDFEHLDGFSDTFRFQSKEDCDRVSFRKYPSPIESAFGYILHMEPERYFIAS